MSQQDYFIQFARELGALNGNIWAAALSFTKAIYQAFIDAIDRLNEKLNAEGK